MATLPLLLLSTPEEANRTKRFGFPPPLRHPPHDRQGQRLSPRFERLQELFKAGRINIQETAAGADPEKVLVIETIGSIANFARAVERIDDFKWMGELADDIFADDDFYGIDEKDDKEKKVPSRLYLVMTNQQGLTDFVSLWKRFRKNESMEFPRNWAPLREAFRSLHDIRYWGVEDRIKETGFLEAWEKDLKHGEGPVRAEVELWLRPTQKQRQNSQEQVTTLIQQNGGKVIQECVIEKIGYHAILAEIPRQIAKEIINHPKVGLLTCDQVMFFSPVGQAMTDEYSLTDDVFNHESPSNATLPKGAPVVGILDGMPLQNHEQLRDRVTVEDPDNYEAEYAVEERVHGTSIASLVIHGDLSDEEDKEPLSHRVYMRPIMKPIRGEEHAPENQLWIDLIHRAVIRMLKGDGEDAAVAPNVKIINLSIGLSNRPFSRAMSPSPLARLLDWLSSEYNVLFVISAGNHSQEIKIEKSEAEFKALPDDEKEAMFVQQLFNDERNRRIFSPAESINGLAVGALHDDATKNSAQPGQMELYKRMLPSPISAFGGGYKRSIKPDLIFSGGRVCYREPLLTNSPLSFEPAIYDAPPGNKSASPLGGAGNRCAYSCGTSNAAALISRMGAKCHDTLLEVIEGQKNRDDISTNIAPLIKAMVVHGCSWGGIGDRLESILGGDENKRQIRNKIGRWLGYGVPNSERVLKCTEQRATLLGLGELDDGVAHVFELPLPLSLDLHKKLRRLTITLAWFSPIKPSTQAYRAASLWFEIDKEVLKVNRQDADWNAVRRGTVQHEVFEGERAIKIAKDGNLKIKVNCRKDAAELTESVSYGIVVTLEVAEGTDVQIYQEIKDQIILRTGASDGGVISN